MKQESLKSFYHRSGAFILLFGGSLLATAVSFFPSLGTLWAAWQTPEYSHGMLIPVIALLIGSHELAKKKPLILPSWSGIPVILIGYACFAVSQLSAFEPPAHYGLLFCIFGITLSFFGRQTTRTLLPAFAYLIFAIPLPRLIQVALTAKLQILSTTTGVFVLQILNIPVFQDGNIIDLGTEKLQVVEACSGLRYMFPLLSFGFLVAFLFDGAMWKRAAIFLSVFPLTLGMNALRIALAGILVNAWGSGMAEGLVHEFQGWAVFLLCLGILLAETWVLSQIGKGRGKLRLDYFSVPAGPFFDGSLNTRRASIAAFTVCAILAAVSVFSSLNERQEIIPARIPFLSFPLALGEWRGQQEILDPLIVETLQATDYWNASYKREGDETPVSLFMAYYASQRTGAAAHSPSNCIPGSGWRIVQSDIHPVALDHMSIPVTRIVIQKDSAKLLVYYWFDQRGRIINEQYGAKWYLLVDSITKKRTDGAIIRVMTPISEAEDISTGDARLSDFLRGMYPATRNFIPE
ncbi:MAG TPA: VPLPA-CTERM-specific exosortase XrtD [Rhodospirillaceae bacterium]|nr:VPLPA-CTERM-specific exosortase XrtD [Rhodospirillaceae bacterium]